MRRRLDGEAEFRHFFKAGLKPGQHERRDTFQERPAFLYIYIDGSW